MKNLKKKQRPWLDNLGRIYPDKKLKVISRGWDVETWEEFFKNTVDVPRQESLVGKDFSFKKYSDKEHKEFLRDHISSKDESKEKEKFKKIVEFLPAKEKLVLTMIYLKGLNYREIEERIGMSENTIRKIEQLGFKKIKAHVEECLFKPAQQKVS
ncbi:MAG: sigma-70 family RNA polymerase sigma factor [Bacteriovoracales bacterium]|nr:sigma-70 family RNA polymerase sigma factor [Bacteriovoracales bacterium]